jgi:hypothetical protein
MRGLFRFTVTEFRLLLRDATALFIVLALPIGFLLIFGSMVSGEAWEAARATPPALAASSSPPWRYPSPWGCLPCSRSPPTSAPTARRASCAACV